MGWARELQQVVLYKNLRYAKNLWLRKRKLGGVYLALKSTTVWGRTSSEATKIFLLQKVIRKFLNLLMKDWMRFEKFRRKLIFHIFFWWDWIHTLWSSFVESIYARHIFKVTEWLEWLLNHYIIIKKVWKPGGPTGNWMQEPLNKRLWC